MGFEDVGTDNSVPATPAILTPKRVRFGTQLELSKYFINEAKNNPQKNICGQGHVSEIKLVVIYNVSSFKET